MRITLENPAPHPVWYILEKGAYPVDFAGDVYYRATLPARMSGGRVATTMTMSCDGKPFAEWDLLAARYLAASEITIRGLGSPAIFDCKQQPPLRLIRGIEAAGGRVVGDSDIWLDPDDTSKKVRPLVESNVAYLAREQFLFKCWMKGYSEERAQAWLDANAAAAVEQWMRTKGEAVVNEWVAQLDCSPYRFHIAATEAIRRFLLGRDQSWEVAIGPNATDPTDFRGSRPTDGIVRVGYGGSRGHRTDIPLIMPGFKASWDAGARVMFWGDVHPAGEAAFMIPPGLPKMNEAESRFHHEGLEYQFRGRFYDVRDYFEDLTLLDVGVCPLAADNNHNRAKSSQKFYEYAMNATAVVASDTAVYRNAIRHGETGFLARDAGEFTKYLTLLIENRDLRQRIGAAAREDVLSRFSTGALVGTWETAMACIRRAEGVCSETETGRSRGSEPRADPDQHAVRSGEWL